MTSYHRTAGTLDLQTMRYVGIAHLLYDKIQGKTFIENEEFERIVTQFTSMSSSKTGNQNRYERGSLEPPSMRTVHMAAVPPTIMEAQRGQRRPHSSMRNQQHR